MAVPIIAYVSLELLDASSGVTVAGEAGDSGTWRYQLYIPTAVILDQFINLYILDSGNSRIIKWPEGFTYGFIVASASSLNTPYGMHFSRAGNLIVADTSNHRIISFPVVCCECCRLASVLHCNEILKQLSKPI